jgi:hypothetical protein
MNAFSDRGKKSMKIVRGIYTEMRESILGIFKTKNRHRISPMTSVVR